MNAFNSSKTCLRPWRKWTVGAMSFARMASSWGTARITKGSVWFQGQR